VIGVEPEWENDAYLSFHAGERVSLPGPSGSIADAIRVQGLGDLTFPLMQRSVDEIITVSEAHIASATLLAATASRLILEPAGELGLAAALAYRLTLPTGDPVVVVGSGGNTTLDQLFTRAANQATEPEC
jgi:threonine dehydratase